MWLKVMKTIAKGAKVWNTNTSTVILTHIPTNMSMNMNIITAMTTDTNMTITLIITNMTMIAMALRQLTSSMLL